MLQYKSTIFRENRTPIFNLHKRAFILPEDGTFVLKHDGDVPLVFALVN